MTHLDLTVVAAEHVVEQHFFDDPLRRRSNLGDQPARESLVFGLTIVRRDRFRLQAHIMEILHHLLVAGLGLPRQPFVAPAGRIRRPVDVPPADRSVFCITMKLYIAYERKIMRENDDLTLL